MDLKSLEKIENSCPSFPVDLPITPLLPSPLSPAHLAHLASLLPPRTSSVHLPNWELKTHVIPAAYPRSHPSSIKAPSAAGKGSGNTKAKWTKQEVWDKAVQILKGQVEMQRDVVEGRVDLQRTEEPLVQVINQFTRPTRSGDTATGRERNVLIFLHGTMLHKELWEPTISHLLQLQHFRDSVDEIWLLDQYSHGQSGYLNDELLGETFEWTDASRDLTSFLLSPISPLLSSHLNTKTHFISHSYGGTVTINSLYSLSLSHPSLLRSKIGTTILLEPIATPPQFKFSCIPLIQRSLNRKSKWGSREEAKVEWRKGFAKFWDERVLELYARYGLRDVEGGKGVELMTRKEGEALQFSTPHSSSPARTFQHLHHLCTLPSLKAPPSIHFLAGTDRSFHPDIILDEVSKFLPEDKVRRVDGLSHYMPEENPVLLAMTVGGILRDEGVGSGRVRL
ncbi:hypothetical protein T439DRAFT_378331 [Meredithblackwellia eburnea MCA 4105]